MQKCSLIHIAFSLGATLTNEYSSIALEGFWIVNIKPFELVTSSEHVIDRHLPDQMVNAVNETRSPKRGRLR